MQNESQTKPLRRGQSEYLSFPQRFGELVSVVCILLFLGFYIYHQVANTGFFTSKFDGWSMLALYGSMIISLAPPLARAFVGSRNPVRPVEAFSNLVFALSCAFFFVVFPFNFAHFADAFPQAVRFLFWWLTNDVAKIALVLGVLGGLVGAGVNIVR